ncbi:hypothetical protein hmeg3_15770 [Herbaspirillum sp. meg3]|uniref:IpaC/SipC family type III secretion system effector n=1 Tax=Herbaspirillum sp. meg3 TaxID=2025949 RepID=UPI000B982D2D|nr:IpaC/SipC family type III secretion system effector [Herbaspirillum sp. meg3]ASU39597.1 hypothetical protein hmeg3_15770 [Herbaspirillum sp. meg3]
MQIFSNAPSLASAAISHAQGTMGEARSKEQIPMSTFFSSLNLDGAEGSDEAQLRNTLRDGLGAMSPESHKEVVSALKDLARTASGTDVGELIDGKLPDVEKEAHKGAGVDRLLELLFMLMMLLGQANTARNGNAAKFGEISVKQAQASGDKGVNAANSNFGGALAGMVLGTVTAGVGFRQFSKGTAGQTKNISTNGRDIKQLRHENTQAGNALNRPTSPMTAASPQQRVNTLDAQGRPVNVQNNQPHLGGDEHAVLNQPSNRTEVRVASQELSQQENYQKYAEQQYAGQVINTFAPQVSNLAQTGAAVNAAAQTAAGKINEAEGAVASTVQHNEEQAAQRSVDLLLKIFSLIVTSSEQSRSTLDSMSQAIKA